MIRLITLNCWKDEGDLAARVPGIGAALAALAPDIVCLQEVYAGGGRDTGAVLAAATGLHCTRIAARQKRRSGVMSTSGVAILSRQPPTDITAVDLPTTPEDGGRKALMCSFETGLGSLQVASLHLSHLRSPAAAALRAAQLAAVVAAAHCTEPLILAGDFNAPWSSPELAALRTPAWTSTEAALNGRSSLIAQPGAISAQPSAFSAQPGALIDHIAVRTGLALVSAALVLDAPAAGLMLSDHAGVMAQIARK